jgi:uncharacterized membrane protein
MHGSIELVLIVLGLALLLVPIVGVWLWVTVLDLRRRVAQLEATRAQRDAATRDDVTRDDVTRGADAAMPPAAARTSPPPAPAPFPYAPARMPAATDRQADTGAAPMSETTALGDLRDAAMSPAAPREAQPSPPPLPDAWHAPGVAPDVTPAAFADDLGDGDRGHARDPGDARPPGWLAAVKRWFTVGNVPVKVGMVVLFAGIAALLKYASDQGWLRLPIQWRLAGVALAAGAALLFGWRQREARRSFALALQGGAIGVLLLVVFAAARRYALLDAGLAFAASVLLVALMAALAHWQASRALAVLAVLAGFLAPVWLADGGGDHVMLFGYYALLNLGIVALAWRHAWRELNLLGFVFTFGIGVAWGVLRYAPELRPSTEPFLWLFFAIYLAIPLLNLLRQPLPRRDAVDGTLVFATPLVTFTLEAGLHPGARGTLAAIAFALALLYALLFLALRRRAAGALLVEAYRVLAVGFATLAVPLALSARATSAVYAVEGAALVWLGRRRERRLPQIVGVLLQAFAAWAFLYGWWRDDLHALPLIANPYFAGLLLLAVAAWFSAWHFQRQALRWPAGGAYLWGLLLWALACAHEVDAHAAWAWEMDVWLLLLVVTGWLAVQARRRIRAGLLSLTFAAGLPLAAVLAAVQVDRLGSPFAGPGLLAWAAFAVLGAHALHGLHAVASRLASWAGLLWWLLWPWVLGLALSQLAQPAGPTWQTIAAALPWLAALWLALSRPAVVAWPWPASAAAAPVPAIRGSLAVVLVVWWARSLLFDGAAAPLPWLPVLNPLLLAEACVLLLLWRGGVSGQAGDGRRLTMLAAVFTLLSVETLRAVHQFADVPWQMDMLGDRTTQAALTVVWSVLGVVGWVLGSRRGQRRVWLAGALLMGVVLLKLLLVDRHNLGNVAGIASFIAYGLLCTVVGYLAPAPPRRQADA